MTWKEVAAAILELGPAQQSEEATVFPPEGCPATEAVPVTGFSHLPIPGWQHVLLTGKMPNFPDSREPESTPVAGVTIEQFIRILQAGSQPKNLLYQDGKPVLSMAILHEGRNAVTIELSTKAVE